VDRGTGIGGSVKTEQFPFQQELDGERRTDEGKPLIVVSASTVLVVWQEGHPAHKNPVSLVYRGYAIEQVEEKPRGTG